MSTKFVGDDCTCTLTQPVVAMRPSIEEIQRMLTCTANKQIESSVEGLHMLRTCPELLHELIDKIIRNQTSIVNNWIDIAINGE